MVGAARFELATPCTPCRCATGLRYAPPRRIEDSTGNDDTQPFGAMNSDCYSILGVPAAATAEEIRAAYRRLARQYHPDLNAGPEAEARMKEINEAYDTLSDPQRRRQYDLTGIAGGAPANMARRSPRRRDASNAFRAREYVPQRGEDIEVALLISRREAKRGGRKTFPVERLEACPRCRGTGLEPEEVVEFGRCWRCGGAQRLPRELRLNTTIPAGVADGGRLRLRGQGNAGRDGGTNGHIYITVRLSQDRGLRRALAFILRHLIR